MRRLVLALTAAVMFGSAASAADLVYAPADVTAPMVPAGHDWSGWYLGGYAGGIFGARFTDTITEPGLNGVDAGVSLQYNAPVGNNWVLSPYVAATIPVQRSSVFGVEVKSDWAAQAGFRLGFAHDRWLPYVFGGGMVAQASASDGFGSNTHVGFVAGAGVDYAVNERWTLGARYSYYSLGPKSYNGTSVGWQGNSVVGTISFKLN